MDSKSICLITWFTSINYGTCIQSYALFKFLKNFGYNVFILPQEWTYYCIGLKHPIELLFYIKDRLRRFLSPIKRKLFRKNLSTDILKEKYKLRIDKNKHFIYNKLKSFPISHRADFKEMLKNTDIFLTGSDQIWNPYYIQTPYLLAFVPKGKKKIAYGSSIGVDSIPNNKISLYKKYLSQFSCIGVREQTAKRILKNFIPHMEIKTVLDPSLLLTIDDWREVIQEAQTSIPVGDRYIFCYFIGKNEHWMQNVSDFSKLEKIHVYCALSESYLIPNCGIPLPEMGIQEFIGCLYNAEYVVTDSFHATALSISFNKKFAVYKRFSDSDSHSQNSRITDLLKTFYCEDRMVERSATKNLELLYEEIDYITINKRMNELRKESSDFLIGSLA